MFNPDKVDDNELLTTERGMFQLEVQKNLEDMNILVEASMVSAELKVKCSEIIQRFVSRSVVERDSNSDAYSDSYGICRGTVFGLLEILGDKNEENHSLFVALRDVIWKTLYSVKGWKYPPERW